MFGEPHTSGPRNGWIEVICGGMFSGKTEELIRRLRRAQIARQAVAIFKPEIDDRIDGDRIVSHDARSITSTPVRSAREILKLSSEVSVAGIDEAQFFDNELPQVCHELSLSGVRVVAAGLDMDYLGQPFGPMPDLMAIAEHVTKLHAICQRCGSPATHSFRLTPIPDQILIGDKKEYEPRCRKCFTDGMSAKQPKEAFEQLSQSDR